MISPMAKSSHNTIVFEQPLNESLRICLRLEKLFDQLDRHVDQTDDSEMALSTLIKILDVTNRPDIKSKLSQTLTQYASSLAQLEQFPQVDSGRLQDLLDQMDGHIDSLHFNQQKIGGELQTNEFLNQIRSQIGNPGGLSDDKAPAFKLWINKSPDQRRKNLREWIKELSELGDIVRLILKLTRESTSPENVKCENGFYQQTLDTTIPCELIQIFVPREWEIYPEVSAGKHRLNIRFLTPDFNTGSRPIQINKNLEFKLNLCRI